MSVGLVNILSFYSPIIISCSILIFSIFSMALGKGLFYLFWLLVATFVRIGILWMIPGSNPYTQFDNSVCAMGEILPYDNSTYSIFVLLFTFFYITTPMYISNNINYVIITFFIIYIIFDILVKVTNGCLSSGENIIGDIVAGGGFGAAIAALIYSSPISGYLFINETSSDKEVCSMPSKQTFKCSVYKNGELVNSTLTSQ
jgi:hypothetical protein